MSRVSFAETQRGASGVSADVAEETPEGRGVILGGIEATNIILSSIQDVATGIGGGPTSEAGAKSELAEARRRADGRRDRGR